MIPLKSLHKNKPYLQKQANAMVKKADLIKRINAVASTSPFVKQALKK